MTLEQIKSAASAKIEMFYPLYKQVNIFDQAPPYTQTDLDKFRTFRDAVRDRCHNLEPQANNIVEPFEDVLNLYSDLEP
jgi:hypothetical protein